MTLKYANLPIKRNCICLFGEPLSLHKIIKVVECLQSLDSYFTAKEVIHHKISAEKNSSFQTLDVKINDSTQTTTKSQT